MPEIQSADPGRKLQERYNLVGASPAPFLSPELVPVVIIDDLTEEQPGLRFASCASFQSPDVGAQSQTALVNRNGANVLLENIKFQFGSGSGAGGWLMAGAGPALSVGLTEVWLDRRLPGTPSAVCTKGVEVGVVSPDLARGTTLSNAMVVVDLEGIVLGNDQKLHFLLAGFNRQMEFYWRWTERPVTV